MYAQKTLVFTKVSWYDTQHRRVNPGICVFLTGNHILVAVLLPVLLRLSYQTVIQRLKILKVLQKGEADVLKNSIKIKEFPKIQRGFLHQTLEAGLSAPGAPSSFGRLCWALFPCTDRQGPLWPEAARLALPRWWLARLGARKKKRQWLKQNYKH